MRSARPSLRARLLLNPSSAGGRARARLRRLLREVPLDLRETSCPAEMTEQARLAVADGLERVLVAGGDGTLHHAIRGLAGSACALGIVPLGTGNDLARALGLELRPTAAALRALEAPVRTIDLGRLEDRPFAGVVGIGIDGDVSRLVRDRIRHPRGSLAYVLALLCALGRFVPPVVTVDYEGGRFEGPVMLAGLANGPCFGGGMRIAPEARIDDGWLDLVIVERVSIPTLLTVFPRIYRGGHLSHPAVRTTRVRSARLRSLSPRTLWADGEPLDDCTAEGSRIDVWSGALRVAV